jgi:anaerobic selenocysteine-containing dehydrogenase
MVFSANPAYTQPDGGAFKDALKAVPFVVSFSPFRDETALMADLILPDHTYLEKTDEVIWPSGLQYPLYGLTQPVVEPLYRTRNSGDVIIELAKGVGDSVARAFPWRGYEAVLEARAQGIFNAGPGLTRFKGDTPVWKLQKAGAGVSPDYKDFKDMLGKVKSGGLWFRPTHAYGNWDMIFRTPTGKFEFSSSRIELALAGKGGDRASMPHYEEVKTDADKAAYPLRMMPYEMINLASGWVPNPPFCNKTLLDNLLLKNESFAEINPKTAAEYDLKQGDRVLVQSPKGQVRVRVNLFEGAMPGVVYLPLGFGHTAYDEFSQDKGVNPNAIIHGGEDPLSGHPAWWNTPVKLIKA